MAIGWGLQRNRGSLVTTWVSSPTSPCKQVQIWSQVKLLRLVFKHVSKASEDGDCTTQRFLTNWFWKPVQKDCILHKWSCLFWWVGWSEAMRMYPYLLFFLLIFLFSFCLLGSEFTGDPLEKEHCISTHRNCTTINRVRKGIIFNPLNWSFQIVVVDEWVGFDT